MIEIRPAEKEEVPLIQELAIAIWRPTYQGVISEDQIDFMLDKSYSREAILQSMDTGQLFYLIFLEGLAEGFMGITVREPILRIEKLYLNPKVQGRGLGKKFIEFAKDLALSQGLSVLELNVNRGNKAYDFYLKQGFKVVETVDIPYYQYVLNDYIMKKNLIS
ncbi:GNAT family N-acetyltransferase [Sphingobacterium sp. HJSM2_6]|uniref:GNAT family N-acetyltransferase n=1 Tax=Sphingobacterium sp. HJSM2_6 TaxID=3366264 RepID=UPI003BC35534